MTTAGDMVTRVRANINEPSTVTDPQRTDTEILAWLDEALFDYMHKVPQEHFPELTSEKTFSGSACGIPDNYMFYHAMTINHTLSGSTTGVDDCWVLSPGDTYLIQNYPTSMGAWCQVRGGTISCGPYAISGTLTYVKSPSHLSSTSVTLDIGHEHETPIIAYATAMALKKVNDADAADYLAVYADNCKTKKERGESGNVERA
jgi:hypothetical protein